MSTATPGSAKGRRTAGLFDIRLVIALLFVIYGVALTVVGATASPENIEKAAGININLWSGLGMLGFSAFMAGWAFLRPVRMPEESETESTD